jgi:hypothetical protein
VGLPELGFTAVESIPLCAGAKSGPDALVVPLSCAVVVTPVCVCAGVSSRGPEGGELKK